MAAQSTRSKKAIAQEHLGLQSRAKWTASLTKLFVDLMVDQIIKGNKPNRFFSKKTWRTICSGFCKKTGLNWDMEQLKGRYAVLRKQYFTVKSLLASKNLRWDQYTGAIVAKKEAWDKYVKEHPDAEALRINGCPIYKQLSTIFSETETSKRNGAAEHTEAASASIPCPSSSEVELSPSESEEVKLVHTISADVGRKKGRQGIHNVIAKGILEMAFASKLTTAAINKYNERYSTADCIRALDELQGVSEELYFAALDLLEHRIARETFLSLKVDKRLTWLRSKCLVYTSS